jgi:PAS domain S-box-containing protein
VAEREPAAAVEREGGHFRQIVEDAPNAILAVDGDRRITVVNRKAEELLGYPREELLGELVDCLVPERFRADHLRFVDSFMRAPTARAMGAGRELFARRKDGSEVPVEIGLSPADTPTGPVVVASIIDISERRRLEAEHARLIEPEREYFRHVVEAAPNAVVAVDRSSRITVLNRRAEELFGYSREELLGQPIGCLVPERFRADHERFAENFLRAPTARFMGAKRELFGRRKDGSEVPVEIGLNPADTPAGPVVVASIIDITERKRLEAEHARLVAPEREYFRHLVDAAPNAFVAVDRNRRIAVVNRKAEELFGYSRSELLGQPIECLVPERFHGHARFAESYLRAPVARQMGAKRELFGRRKDGSEVPVEIGLNPADTPAGPVVVASIIDITERKRFEAAHDWLAAIVDSSADAIIGKTLDGTITSWNRGAERLFYYPPDEVVGQPIFILLPQSRVDEELRLLERLARDEYLETFETRRLRRDGSEFDVSVTLSPVRDASGRVEGASSIVRDITGQQRMKLALIARDMQMRQLAGRLNAMREEERTRLSRRVHDELGQLLTGLKMDLHWLAKQVDPAASPAASPVLARFAAAGELVDNAMKTVQNIALELRPSVLDALGLPAALRDESRRFEERTGVSTVVRADDAALPNPTVATQLFRIFQELLANVTRHAKASTLRVDFHGRGGEWVLRLEDDGVGFSCDEWTLRSSLGLLGMKERAELLGGTFRIESAVGGGTVATVLVPQ